ncbi:MAG: PPC domain-containing protein [Acidobacteria bacterium]|nr:PPC domain-containing protein [Acidobacteriota bacterium]
MTSVIPRLWIPAAALALMAAPAFAQTALPLDAPAEGRATDAAPAEYTFVAKSAGVLSAAVQGTGDLVLQLVDEDGQTVPNGTADRDLNGSSGTELLSATIGEAGTYKVRVRVQGGDASTFQIAGAFLAFPPFARPADPDRRPAQARALQVGKPHDDTLDPKSGDAWDWFSFKADADGALAIITRPQGGTEADLVLEAYADRNFAQAVDRSDQDMQGNSSNESVTVNVTAGQIVHIKVINQSGNPSKYRVSSSLIQ